MNTIQWQYRAVLVPLLAALAAPLCMAASNCELVVKEANAKLAEERAHSKLGRPLNDIDSRQLVGLLRSLNAGKGLPANKFTTTRAALEKGWKEGEGLLKASWTFKGVSFGGDPLDARTAARLNEHLRQVGAARPDAWLEADIGYHGHDRLPARLAYADHLQHFFLTTNLYQTYVYLPQCD